MEPDSRFESRNGFYDPSLHGRLLPLDEQGQERRGKRQRYQLNVITI